VDLSGVLTFQEDRCEGDEQEQEGGGSSSWEGAAGCAGSMRAEGGDEGLMCEVLAMQQNLQELEQDLLQLGCEFVC
jgi:hypothetical protein